MTIRLAEKEDFPRIMEMIREAQAALRADHVPQWQNGYPTEEIILEDIQRGENYVCEIDGNVVGTMVLSFAGEVTYQKIYDGNWLTGDVPYGVIHRLAVSESWKRQGIAGFMLKYALEECKRRAVTSLRIDTHEQNKTMRSWLNKNHFIYCGNISLLAPGNPRVAYERCLTEQK